MWVSASASASAAMVLMLTFLGFIDGCEDRVIMAAWNVMELGLGERKRIIFFILMLFDSFNVIVLIKIINLNSPVIQTYNILHESGHIGAVKYGLNTRMHDF